MVRLRTYVLILILLSSSQSGRIARGAIVTLIDDSTSGRYNSSLGNVLDGTSPLFPVTNTVDPTFNPAPEPDLTPAAAILGQWLSNPISLNQNWSNTQPIPLTWASGTETAIVYAFEVPDRLENFNVQIGVDNGAFVWLDGNYLGGQVMPGVVFPGELNLSVPAVATGLHHLQILREDHGSIIGFTISVKASVVPEPSSLSAVFFAITSFCLLHPRRR